MDAAGLRREIDELVGLDAAGLDDADLHELLVAVERERARLAVASARQMCTWSARGLHRLDGSRSAAHRLARETGTTVSGRRRDLARARNLDHVPQVAAAVLQRRMSVDMLDEFSRVATPERRPLFARDEQMLVRTCEPLSCAQARRALAYWAMRADHELHPTDTGLAPEPDPGEHGTAHLSPLLDGRLALHAELTPIAGSIVEGELTRLMAEIKRSDDTTGLVRSVSQRRAAALVEMATRSRSTPAGARRPACSPCTSAMRTSRNCASWHAAP